VEVAGGPGRLLAHGDLLHVIVGHARGYRGVNLAVNACPGQDARAEPLDRRRSPFVASALVFRVATRVALRATT
jgi:hypothetical protein